VLLWWAAGAATVAFTYLAVRDVEWDVAWRALRESDWWWVVPSAAVMGAGLVVRAVRWSAVFAPETRPPFHAVWSALLVGYFFNTVLPLRAGEAIRIVVLSQRARVSRVETLGTVGVERAMDVVALLVLFLAAAAWMPEVSWLRSVAVFGAVLAVAIATAVVALTVWGTRPVHATLRPLARLRPASAERLEHAADSLARGLAALRRPRIAAAGLLWTTLSWLVFALSAWLLMIGFDLDLPPLAGLLVLVATGLAMILPSPPAAIGVFEGAVVVALRAYDVSASHALPYAVVLHLMNALPFILAGPFVIGGGVRWPRRAVEATDR
jgi:glycosyltransferase 2 family protein